MYRISEIIFQSAFIRLYFSIHNTVHVCLILPKYKYDHKQWGLTYDFQGVYIIDGKVEGDKELNSFLLQVLFV